MSLLVISLCQSASSVLLSAIIRHKYLKLLTYASFSPFAHNSRTYNDITLDRSLGEKQHACKLCKHVRL